MTVGIAVHGSEQGNGQLHLRGPVHNRLYYVQARQCFMVTRMVALVAPWRHPQAVVPAIL